MQKSKSTPIQPTRDDVDQARAETPNFDALPDAQKYRLAQAAALIRSHVDALG